MIHLVANFLPPEEFLSLVEPRLATRPIEIEWHRAYHDACCRANRRANPGTSRSGDVLLAVLLRSGGIPAAVSEQTAPGMAPLP